jgi:lipoprotein-anchoring transpeptidase ErfK/SrfK
MKAINLVFAMALFQLFATTSLAQKGKDLMVEPAYEASAGVLFDEAAYLAGTSPISQFTNVLVVNKAAQGTTAQTIRMFTDGKEVQLEMNKVSTGAEDVEMVSAGKKTLRKIGRLFGAKGSFESHWKHTTRGFYSVKRVEGANYTSGSSKFHMPYAVFFNDVEGLALHAVPPEFADQGGNAQLGRRASSGCVRLYKTVIPGVNQAVRDAGKGLVPVINIKTGLQELDAKGNPKTQNGFKSIVIVQEVND